MYKKIPPSLCDNYTKKLFLETGENWVTLRFAPSCWNYIISIRSLFRRVRYIYLYNLYIIWMYAAVQKSSHTSTHTLTHTIPFILDLFLLFSFSFSVWLIRSRVLSLYLFLYLTLYHCRRSFFFRFASLNLSRCFVFLSFCFCSRV